MNKRYIEDNHIVDRYLLGQLSDNELCEFEAYYFEHPEMLEELTIAKAMHNSMRKEAKLLQPDKTLASNANWFSWLFQPKLGLAMSAIMALGVGSLWLENTQLKNSQTVAFPAASLVLSQSRSVNSEIDEIEITNDQSAIAISLVTGPIGYSEVGLQLTDKQENILWQGKTKVDGPVGSVNLVVVSSLFASGEYTLSVFPPTDSLNALSSHKFKVVQN